MQYVLHLCSMLHPNSIIDTHSVFLQVILHKTCVDSDPFTNGELVLLTMDKAEIKVRWHNYQSAVCEYQIFDRNPNLNIWLPNYWITHSSTP